MSNDLLSRPDFVPPRRTGGHGVWDLDLYRGFAAWPLWRLLGWNDIRLRYRRSVLGPFWITLSMTVLIVVLGIVYSRIFHMELRTYLPYVALGFIVWGFISTSMLESCGAFQDSERIIKQIKVPFSAYVLRVIWRNVIVLMHTLVLLIPISLIYAIWPGPVTLLAIPGLALVFINQIWIGILLAVISTRFRDIPPIVASLVQIMMFATPIMWPVSSLGNATLLADINPVHHLIEIVRAPLLGQVPDTLSWIVTGAMAVVGMLFAAVVLRRASRLIVYWL